MTEKDRKKLLNTCTQIFESDEYKSRRKEQDRYLKYYAGRYWAAPTTPAEKMESEISANLIFSTTMTIAPLLTDNKPIWGLRAKAPYYQPLSQVYKAAGDCLWNVEEMDTKVFKAVMDSLVMKYGIFQVVFDPNRSVEGEISIDVIDPRTYFQAPGFEDNWEAPLCGTKTRRSMWWIKKNYPDKIDEVKPESSSDSKSQSRAASRVDTLLSRKQDHQYMVEEADVWTVWMLDDSMIELPTVNADGEDEGKRTKAKKYPNGRLIVFTQDVVLEDKPYPYNHGKPPWVFLYDYITPHSTFGMGEADQIEGLSLEYNLLLRRFAKHCRIYTNKNWTIPDNWEDPEAFKTKAAEGDNAWAVPPGAEPPSQIKTDPFDQSAMQFINGLPSIIQEISGVTEVSKGMAGKKQRQSAHEITALLETSYTRTRQRVRNLEASIKRVFTLVVELMQQFYSETRTFSLKNNNNETEWYSIANTPDFARDTMRPEMAEGEGKDAEEDAILKQQWQDYTALGEAITNEDAVTFKFEIDIETNSTLPLDQQSLANTALQLAQLGRIDTLTLLEVLHYPNPERIVKRLKEEAAVRQGQPSQPPGAPGALAAVMGGQNG